MLGMPRCAPARALVLCWGLGGECETDDLLMVSVRITYRAIPRRSRMGLRRLAQVPAWVTACRTASGVRRLGGRDRLLWQSRSARGRRADSELSESSAGVRRPALTRGGVCGGCASLCLVRAPRSGGCGCRDPEDSGPGWGESQWPAVRSGRHQAPPTPGGDRGECGGNMRPPVVVAVTAWLCVMSGTVLPFRRRRSGSPIL
jgi:hypothetical protein